MLFPIQSADSQDLLESVSSVAFITAHEETQENRVCYIV